MSSSLKIEGERTFEVIQCQEEDEPTGWCKVKVSSPGFYHKRFWCLQNTQLQVYKTELLVNPKCTIDLQNASINERRTRHVVFSLPNEKQISFKFLSEEEALLWLSLIQHKTRISRFLSMDFFQPVSLLGQGHFGKVLLCRDILTDELIAVKSVHKSLLGDRSAVRSLCNEKTLLSMFNHPFIASFKFACRSSKNIFMGMEYPHGGDLTWYIKDGVPLESVQLIIAELALALDYIHQKGYAYRDLKPENVLLGEDGHVRLIDFGLTKSVGMSLARTFCGTSEYLAPEIILRDLYGCEVDFWALGILMYELLFKVTPFVNPDKGKMFNQIVNSKIRFPKGTNKHAKGLIRGLLRKSPLERFRLDDIKKHPFFKDINFKDVYEMKVEPSFFPSDNTNRESDVLDSFGSTTHMDSSIFDGFSCTEEVINETPS